MSEPLPGPAAHEPLRARPLGPLIPRFDHQQPPRPGSVLILLCIQDCQWHFPLIKRPSYPGLHGGQVSFPGGKAEPGENPEQTALREAQEEIGVTASQVEIIGRLSDFYLIPSNFMVTPVVGVAHQTVCFTPDRKEVERVLLGKLADVLSPEAVRTREIKVADRYRMMAPHFEVEGEVVWGATAMILNEFRMIVREIFFR